jgi:hypothetical protein
MQLYAAAAASVAAAAAAAVPDHSANYQHLPLPSPNCVVVLNKFCCVLLLLLLLLPKPNSENYLHMPKPSANCVITMLDGSTMTGPCYNAMTAPLCADNGDIKLPFGEQQFFFGCLLSSSLKVFSRL